MRNKVITMTDSKYFKYGQKLLENRHIVDADFVCYGPDLNEYQIGWLRVSNIKYKKVKQDIWDTWMQSLKFQFIMDEIDESGGGITFVDWDTYFLKDWGGIFYRANWDIGITIRTDYFNKGVPHRAVANGGVIFAKKHSSNINIIDLLKTALNCIELGGLPELPEYDLIWKTLEQGRKPEKTHYRTDKRWWCDQVFLSALALNCSDYRVKKFDCRQYNNIWEETPDTYIMHLKEKSGAPGSLKDGK